MPPWLTLNVIRYGSRINWSHLGKAIAPSSTPRCHSYEKGAFESPTTAVTHFTYIYIYIYIYIIIIMSCHQYGYPWPSLTTLPCHSSLLAGPKGYIPYPHRAAVCRFARVTLLLLGYVRWSIGKYDLWARTCFSSSVLHVWFD